MVHRKVLYAGVFLVAAGAVMLVAQGNAAARETVEQALRLWPLALIALGAGLLVRHTRLGLAGGMVAAAMPGLLLGGVVAAAPEIGPVCIDATPTSFTTREGVFGADASVDLSLGCGEVTVTTAPGTGWLLELGDRAGAEASVIATGDGLAVASTSRRGSFDASGHDDWRLRLPTGTTLDLTAQVNAGQGRLDLAGARLGRLDVDVNAGEVRLDLTGAVVPRLRVDVKAGAASVRLPATGDLAGGLSVAAGSLEICAPAGLGLRVRGDAALGTTTYNGLVRTRDAWETPGYSSSTYRADLSVSASVGSVVINPVGGCK